MKNYNSAKIEISVIVTTLDINNTTAPYVKGDINKDGVINIKDVTVLQKHIAGIMTVDEDFLWLTDANSDGITDIKDATHLQKFIALIILAL